MGAQQPWMYSGENRSDSRLPETTFDPKAVTRASWAPKPPKPQHSGPLLSFNTHPDAHAVLRYRSGPHPPMAPRTKKWIKRSRWVQLALRVLELNGALGILVVMILLTRQDVVKGWVRRIAPGIIMLHCMYAVYHLSRHAGGRTPASSAAYHMFSAFADLVAMGIYAFSAFTTHQESDGWRNRIAGREDLTDYFVPAVYYGAVAAGGLHVISLSISLWLGYAFRKISLLPPDLNPLEDNLTARPQHKRNKSSMTTLTTVDTDNRSSVPYGSRPGTGISSGHASIPPTVPFMHTREGSRVSLSSGPDSRINLPSRQYQVTPANWARSSNLSVESRRMTRPAPASRGSYAGVPMDEPSFRQQDEDSGDIDISRVGRFTESWAPTNSLVTRTNQRNWNVAGQRTSNRATASYSALGAQQNDGDSSESEYDDENDIAPHGLTASPTQGNHPSPLSSNPLRDSRSITGHKKTDSNGREPTLSYISPSSSEVSTTWSFRPEALGELSSNSNRTSTVPKTQDIADAKAASSGNLYEKRSSAYLDEGYSKRYGDLKSATPPLMIGADRKVSSGNDYKSDGDLSAAYPRRNVSGKVAEEGRAGNRTSRFSFYTSKNKY